MYPFRVTFPSALQARAECCWVADPPSCCGADQGAPHYGRGVCTLQGAGRGPRRRYRVQPLALSRGVLLLQQRRHVCAGRPFGEREREFFIDNLLVRIHFIIVMIRWTGLAPWECEFPFPGGVHEEEVCSWPHLRPRVWHRGGAGLRGRQESLARVTHEGFQVALGRARFF